MSQEHFSIDYTLLLPRLPVRPNWLHDYHLARNSAAVVLQGYQLWAIESRSVRQTFTLHTYMPADCDCDCTQCHRPQCGVAHHYRLHGKSRAGLCTSLLLVACMSLSTCSQLHLTTDYIPAVHAQSVCSRFNRCVHCRGKRLGVGTDTRDPQISESEIT